MAKALDDEIDRLYQLPLDEFTAARNALAKETGESAIKKLEKPNLAAWAVNQLYWRQRKTYDDVIKAAERMRAAYKQMLAGKTADVRGAEEIHQEALREAKQAARAILEEGGHGNADALMMPVSETLDALPGDDPAGRLTKPLRRMGFNVLEGVPISAKAAPQRPKAEPAKQAVPDRSRTAKDRKASEAEARQLAMTRERLRFAEAAEREAEATLERATRAVERTARTRERVERELREATDAEKAAMKEHAASEKALEKAQRDRERLSRELKG